MNENLKMILQKEKLENLPPHLTSQNITNSCLPVLGDDCLVELGVEKMGDHFPDNAVTIDGINRLELLESYESPINLWEW
jgi:hypothetical protein